MARTLKALVTKSSFKERYKTTQSYLAKLKFLTEDVRLKQKTPPLIPFSTAIFSHKIQFLMSSCGLSAEESAKLTRGLPLAI